MWSIVENFDESQFKANYTTFGLIDCINSKEICGNENLYNFPFSLLMINEFSFASQAEI